MIHIVILGCQGEKINVKLPHIHILPTVHSFQIGCFIVDRYLETYCSHIQELLVNQQNRGNDFQKYQ